MSIHVFVGGTYKDLIDFRQGAYDSLRRRATVETMEDFPNSEKAPPELCRQRLEKCSHYLLIIGQRYGWIPPGCDKSITELEYGWVKTLKLPMKIYIYEPGDTSAIINDNKDKLDTFKARVRNNNSPRDFKDLADLKCILELTLRDWFEDDGPYEPHGYGTAQSGNVFGNITNSAVIIGNNNSVILNNNFSDDNIDQLGQVYEERLSEFVKRRLIGDGEGAWNDLKRILEDFLVRKIPVRVAARYYLLAAHWTIADFLDSPDAERYYKHAISLDKEIDTRSFRAKQLMINGHYDEANEVLEPLDKESVLNTALQLLLEKGKGQDADSILVRATVKLTHTTHQLLALCHLQAKNFPKAESEIQRAIIGLPNAPIYHLTAGFIAYWQGIPSDIHDDIKSLGPTFFKPGLFNPSPVQTRYLEEALAHFEEARRYADFHNEPVMMRSIREAWLLTASLLTFKRKDADLAAITLLKEDSSSGIALLYVVENKLPLDDIILSPIHDLIRVGRANINHISALVRLYLEKRDSKEAIALIKKYELEFISQDGRSEWLHLMVEAYALDGKWPEADSLIDTTNGIDVHAKNRLKCFLYEKSGQKSELFKLMRSLATNPGTRIDLGNLCLLYRRANQWDDIIPVAQQWLTQYPDAEAVIFLAEAQLRLDLPQDCLKTLREYENLFPDGRLSTRANYMKMQALWELGMTDKALEIANKLWIVSPSQNLLLNRAQLYICEGDVIGTVSVLQDGLKQGFKSPALLFMIANLISAEHPDDAFGYAKQALDHFQNDPEVYCSTILMGYRTGHDYEASKLLAEFHLKYPGSKLFKKMSTIELIPMMNQYNTASEHRWQLYRTGQVPLHVILDAENASMGVDFYWRWHHNREADYSCRMAFPLVYGGREEIDLNLFKDQIFMDYSACLVAHALKLFDALGKAFSQLIVPRSLLASLLREINELKNIQPSCVESRKNLLSALKRLKLKEIPQPQVSLNDSSNLLYSDRQQWFAAREHNALIVEDNFATKIFEGRQVPTELQALQVYTCEVIEALVRRGEIANELVKLNFEGKEVRDEVVNRLIELPPSLLVDSVFLERMLEIGWLDIVVDNFELLLFENTITDLQEEQQRLEKRADAIKWLDKLLAELRGLKRKGRIIFSPVGKDTGYEEGYTLLLKEAFTFGNRKNGLIWCDDRCINSYSKIEAVPVVSVFDVLAFLYNKGYITVDYYREKIHLLFRSNVQFKVPPLIHLTMALEQAKIDDGNNFLRETKFLKVIRQSIAYALSEHSVINKFAMQHTRGPEIAGYLKNLWVTMENTLINIWNNPGKEDAWQNAASDWLLWHCSDSAGDVLHFLNDPAPIDKLIGFKHATLISFGFRLFISGKDGEHVCNRYFRWLFKWLEHNWHYNPNVKLEVIESLLSLITGLAEDFKKSKDLRQFVAFRRFLDNFEKLLPVELRDRILRHTKIQKVFELLQTNVLLIEGIDDIPEVIWSDWVQRAVTRGLGINGSEVHAGNEISVMLLGDSLAQQVIRLEWSDEQGNLYKTHILEPFAQLQHPDSTYRRQWLDMAETYLHLGDKHEFYTSSLCNPADYRVYIKEVKDLFEQSSQFFFERLFFLIKVTRDQLPDERYLFPDEPAIFHKDLSQIPSSEDKDGEQWLSYCHLQIAGRSFDSVLSLLCNLPLGPPWSLTIMLNRLVEDGFIDIGEIRECCLKLLESTLNPIKQQNLIAILLRYQQNLEQDQITLLNKKLIDLMGGEGESMSYSDSYRLYIWLLKYAWRSMLLNDNYRDYSEEQKILWSYIYADRIINIFQELITNKTFPYPISVVADTFEKLAEALLSNMHPLRERKICPLEVTHPEVASTWRTIFGGTIAVLQDHEDLIAPIKICLLPILIKIETECALGKLIIDGAEEQLLTFGVIRNCFHSSFDNNNRMRLQAILAGLNENTLVPFDSGDNASKFLKQCLDLNDLDKIHLTYLWILSRQPITSFLLYCVTEILEKYRLARVMAEDKILLQGRIFADLIKALPTEYRKYYMDLYKEDVIQIFQNSSISWESYLEIIARIYSSEDYFEASQSFVLVLEETFSKQAKIKVTTSIFSFICNIAWWLPTSLLGQINRLRRELNVC